MNFTPLIEFKQNITKENAIKLGKRITLTRALVEEKKKLFSKAFDCKTNLNKEIRSILNMWATAVLLEEPNVPKKQKIVAVRTVIKDSHIDNEMLEEWIETIYELRRAPEDLLKLMAIDIKNVAGLSEEVRKILST